jgi:hypothetical protein
MTDPNTAADHVMKFMLPALPALLHGRNILVEEFLKEAGKDVWHLAKQYWDKLVPRMAEKPPLDDAVKDAAALPKDPRTQDALREQLKKEFSKDPAFLSSFLPLVELVQAGSKAPHVVHGLEISGGSQLARYITNIGVANASVVIGDRETSDDAADTKR